MPTKLKIKTSEIGNTGVDIFHGIITGEEYNRDLYGFKGLRAYDEMRRSDPKVGQSLWALKFPVIQSEWFVEAGGDTATDLEAQRLVEYCLFEAIQWSTTLEQFLTYLDFGHNVNEIVITPGTVDGQMRQVLQKVAYRKALSIQRWETQDAQPGITQLTNKLGNVSIPEEKILRFTNRQEGDNYEGISILRSAYKPWRQKIHLENIEMVGYDRQALGVPYAKYPSTASTVDKDKVEELLREMRANEQAYIMTPLDWEHGWMESSGTVVKEIKNAIMERDSAILSNVFADFLDIGKRSSGSRSTSEDHSRFFELACTAVADYIRDIVNLKLIPTLVDLNFTVDSYPKIQHGKIGDENLPVLSEAIAKFVAAKALTIRPEDENIVRKMTGFPELSADEIEERKQQADEAREQLKLVKDAPGEDEPADDAELKASATAIHHRLTRKLYVPPRRAA